MEHNIPNLYDSIIFNVHTVAENIYSIYNNNEIGTLTRQQFRNIRNLLINTVGEVYKPHTNNKEIDAFVDEYLQSDVFKQQVSNTLHRLDHEIEKIDDYVEFVQQQSTNIAVTNSVLNIEATNRIQELAVAFFPIHSIIDYTKTLKVLPHNSIIEFSKEAAKHGNEVAKTLLSNYSNHVEKIDKIISKWEITQHLTTTIPFAIHLIARQIKMLTQRICTEEWTGYFLSDKLIEIAAFGFTYMNLFTYFGIKDKLIDTASGITNFIPYAKDAIQYLIDFLTKTREATFLKFTGVIDFMNYILQNVGRFTTIITNFFNAIQIETYMKSLFQYLSQMIQQIANKVISVDELIQLFNQYANTYSKYSAYLSLINISGFLSFLTFVNESRKLFMTNQLFNIFQKMNEYITSFIEQSVCKFISILLNVLKKIPIPFRRNRRINTNNNEEVDLLNEIANRSMLLSKFTLLELKSHLLRETVLSPEEYLSVRIHMFIYQQYTRFGTMVNLTNNQYVFDKEHKSIVSLNPVITFNYKDE